MATGNHKVKTQRMELTFANEAKANELHAVVRELCFTEVQDVIERTLDTFNSSESIIYSFRKIELDMGCIEFCDLNKELPQRVSRELARALKTAFVDLNANPELEMRVLIDSDLRSISHFLRHGFLPWNARNHDLISLLLESIKSTPKEFAVSVRQLGASLQVRVRLTERFTSEILQKIIGVLEPGDAATIIEYHKHLSILNKKETIVNAPQEGLEKILWLFVFNHLLTEQGSDFNRKTFAISVLRQFSCHFNVEFDDLLLLLRSGLRRWSGEVPIPFSHLIEEIVDTWIPAANDDLRLDAGKTTTNTSADDGSNAKSPPTDDLFNSSVSWKKTISDLLDDEPDGILLLLRRAKDKPKIIHKIVSEGKPSLTKRILKRIAPVESATIIKYHSNLVALHSADPVPNTTQHEVENILWTFMIVHIVESHTSYFNYKSFLRSLIFSFSAHYNLVEAELLEKLISSARFLPAQSAGMRRFLSIINEIYTEVTEQSSSVNHNRRSTNQDKQAILSRLLADQKNLAGPQYEETVFHFLNTNDAGSIAAVKKHLRDDRARKRFALFSPASFNKVVKYLFPSSTASLVGQYITLASRIEKQIVSYFGAKEQYNKAVQLSILEIIETVERFSISHSKVFDLLVRSLVSQAYKLSIKQVHAFASFYRDAPQLNLVSKLIKSDYADSSSFSGADPVVSQLVNKVLSFSADRRNENFYPGFPTIEEALVFLQSQHPNVLRQEIVKLSERKQEEFISNLGHTELDLFMSVKTERKSYWYSDVLRVWEHQLMGLNNRKEVAAALKRAVLMGYVFRNNPSVDILASHLLAVFEKYHIPDSFFESLVKWSLPKFGDATRSILSIEKQVLSRGNKTAALKKKDKLSLVTEALQEAKARDNRVKEIAPELDAAKEIFISNAGLVLVHPYLSFLFEERGLMKDGKFPNPESAMRAVAMLHYASTGTEAFKEEDHVLNKLLCGVNVHENSTKVKLKRSEKGMVNSMLKALTEHWSIIKNSSEDDVRGNWLIREGKLRETEEYWELIVKRQPYDLLMDSLPFTLSPIKYSWMKKMIMIQWL